MCVYLAMFANVHLVHLGNTASSNCRFFIASVADEIECLSLLVVILCTISINMDDKVIFSLLTSNRDKYCSRLVECSKKGSLDNSC